MSDIFNERQAFNFYRSYYDTSLLLDKENRAEFLDSILHYQFTGEVIMPKLPFALLAFNGQMHSLKKQVNGYTRGKETYPNGNPTKGEGKGEGKANDKGKGKEVQVQGEVQEKEEEKEENNTSGKPEKLNFDLLLGYLNRKTGRCYRVVTDKVKAKYNSVLRQGYTKDDIKTAINNAVRAKNHIDNNFQYLTMEFFSRTDKLDMYSDKKETLVIEGETKEQRAYREHVENYKNLKIH